MQTTNATDDIDALCDEILGTGTAGSSAQPTKRKARVIPLRLIPDDDEDDAGNGRPQPTGGGSASALLAAALSYARRGWPVLPLHSIRDGRCTCRKPECDRPGKHPLGRFVPQGVKDATTDENTIRAWWASVPAANIGLATGAESGLVVLDVDPARGGEDSLNVLQREHGTLPETPKSRTGSGGAHFLLKHPGVAIRNRVNLAAGLDVRGDGGYIVAPPSLHASGEQYAWLRSPDDTPLAEMPDWLLALLSDGDGGRDEDKDDDTRAGELPEDWDERLLRDAHLLGYWTRKKALNGEDQSMSAYALAIANRLVREYPGDTDAQRIAILSAFYKAHGKTARLTKLRLTLKKAMDGAPPPAGKAIIVRLADVKPTKVRWLDPDRVPLGKLTILDGDPGLGKSGITLDYAARVSTGREMPDGRRGDLYEKPAGVVILSAEDDLEDTIRPRLDAMGADCDRIVNLKGIATKDGECPPTLADLTAMEEAVKAVNAKLVIVDPLVAYVPDTGNPNSDHKMRRLLTPLAQFAQRLGVAVLVVRHLNKRTGEAADVSALYRGGGSIGIAGAARSVLLVASDKDDPTRERRIMARVKGNLSEPPKALAYRTEKADNGSVVIKWDGEVDQDPDELLRPPTEDEQPSKIGEAVDWLASTLAGGPVEAKQVRNRAHKDGIKDRTLDRAKQRLKVVAEKEEGIPNGRWMWSLP